MLKYLDKQEGIKIAVDYFSCSFPLKVNEQELEIMIIENLVTFIAEFMNFDSTEVNKEDYSNGRYRYQYTVGENITLRFAGPELSTGYRSCQIEMRGQGCREFEYKSNKNWIELFDFFLLRLDGSPTRLDIAIDDYDGTNSNIEKIKTILDTGNYTTCFRKKYYKLMGCNEEGWTLQFGSHKSTMMLVIYDKLKEQKTKGNEVNQDFWTRYEMRYMKEKAYDVVMNYSNLGFDKFADYSFGLLYAMLDLKEPNNYGEESIHKANTISWWKTFLNDVRKSEIVKYKVKSSSLDTYKIWVLPIISMYYIMMFAQNGKDFDLTYHSILNDLTDYLDKVDQKKLKKLNSFQIEVGQNKLTLLDIQNLKTNAIHYVSMHQLPF